MKNYESIVIFEPTLQDEGLKKAIKKFETVLEGSGCSAIVTKPWGRKEIAYNMNGFKSGHFVCYEFQSDKSDSIDAYQLQLRLDESVVRFKTHRINLPKRKFKGRRVSNQVTADWASDDFTDDLDVGAN